MTETELHHQSELADARLEVAEELWWPIAFLAATTLHLKWGNWLLDVIAIVGIYFLVVRRYRRAARNAEDEYFRVAQLGQYAIPQKKDNA
jgi:hypothetical protein